MILLIYTVLFIISFIYLLQWGKVKEIKQFKEDEYISDFGFAIICILLSILLGGIYLILYDIYLYIKDKFE